MGCFWEIDAHRPGLLRSQQLHRSVDLTPEGRGDSGANGSGSCRPWIAPLSRAALGQAILSAGVVELYKVSPAARHASPAARLTRLDEPRLASARPQLHLCLSCRGEKNED